MQDSLEDYLKGIKNIKQPKEPTISNNLLQQAEHKKKCEAYAQGVVEFLIDGQLKPKSFLKSLDFINPSLYQDVIEERAITKLCGYPICGQPLDMIPKQQYKISKKRHNVYEITERKNFCSNFCYMASCHIKKQVDSAPLWLRKPEDRKSYNLFEQTNSGLEPGEEVQFGVKKDETASSFISVSSFTEASLGEAEENEILQADYENNDVPEVIMRNDNFKKSILKRSHSPKKVSKTENENKIAKTDFEETKLDTNQSGSEELPNENAKQRVSFDESQPSCSFAKEEETAIKINSQKGKRVSFDESLCETKIIEDIRNNFKSELEELIFEDRIKSVELDTEKINKAIEKIEISEKLKENKPVLIETTKNPESNTKATMPKFSQRILEKIKTPAQEDQTKTSILNKVKSKEIDKKNKSKENDKMMEILMKLKNKDQNKKAGTIMIDPAALPVMTNKDEVAINDKPKELKKINNKFDNQLEILHLKLPIFKWFTLETFIFIHGEDKVKNVLTEEKLCEYFDKMKIAESNIDQKMKYMEICKRIQLKELADEKFESSLKAGELKPLPDFATLKEESKKMDLKVKTFYSGKMFEKDDTNFPQKKKNEESCEEEVPSFLPMVDVSSQNALRRKIFMNSLKKFVQVHITELSLEENLLEILQELTSTFKLSADNIVFKPFEWNFISLLLIFILSKKYPDLQSKVTEEDKNVYKMNTLETYKEGNSLFNDIFNYLDSIEDFAANYIKNISEPDKI